MYIQFRKAENFNYNYNNYVIVTLQNSGHADCEIWKYALLCITMCGLRHAQYIGDIGQTIETCNVSKHNGI